MEFSIYNKKLELIYILDEYESLIWTERYYDCGDFEIYTPVTRSMLNLVVNNEYLYVLNPVTNTLMIMDGFEIDTDPDTGNKITITGRSSASILSRRLIIGKLKYTGPIADFFKKILTENVIAPSDPSRTIPNWTFKEITDKTILDIIVDVEYENENLYDVISELCKKYSIGFKVNFTLDNKFEVEFYNGVDHSYAQLKNPYVIFSSEFENLGSSNYLQSYEDYKNVAILKTSNTESSLSEVNPSKVSGIDRREMLVIADDGKDGKTAIDKAFLELSKNKPKIAFEGQIATEGVFGYGKDFSIGDIIHVQNEYGIESRARITEIVTNQDQDTYEIYPTFESIGEE